MHQGPRAEYRRRPRHADRVRGRDGQPPIGYAATLIGDRFANRLTGEGIGNRTLIGNGGDDVLTASPEPCGDAGPMPLSGGAGDNLIRYDDGGGIHPPRYADSVHATGGDGVDVIVVGGR